MDVPPRKRMDHEVPDWIGAEAEFFVTVCAEPRGVNHFCNSDKGPILIESIRNRHERRIWFCHLAVLMPDHIHLLLSFPPEKTLARVVSEWKGWLGRYQDVSWQRNFFDHRLRDEENIKNKADYVVNNPVRAGLVTKAKDWPYMWMPDQI